MKLSDGEKLIIAMLAQIMKVQGVKSDIDPDFILEAIFRNHPWAIKWEHEGLFGNGPSEQVIDETADIMTMWRVIEDSMRALPAEEQTRVKEQAYPHGHQFEGFDGNNDPHFGVATFLVERLDRFQEFKGRGLNSHSIATLPNYRRNYDAWRQIRDNNFAGGGLTADQIIQILRA